jgi:spermidine synthase
MASLAAERINGRPRPRVLVGGLGMGFTLRAALDCFGPDARITVSEILTEIIDYNRGELGPLAGHPLDDPRAELHAGDVRQRLLPGAWDAILLDVDNGPDALTVPGNASLYTERGMWQLGGALAPGGVAVIWSAFESPAFVRRVRGAGLHVESHRARSRASGKGSRHTLFAITAAAGAAARSIR